MEERFTYDMLDRLTGVVEGLDTTGVFAYDAYGRMTSKYLHGAGNCEFVTEDNGAYSTSYSLTYLSGPLGVFAVRDTRMQPESRRMYYVHPDHLGSWTTVTAWNGNVVQDVWFDPWGTAHNITPGGEPSPVFSLLFDRGFTGHEHMMLFGLINMNGRVYDPVTSSFLSVDNYVQDPSYTQNFNRYAYCMNNPLKYTDPDGEIAVIDDILIAAAIGAAINITMNGISNISNGNGFFKGAGYAAIIGGLAGASGAGMAALGFGAAIVGATGGAVSGGASAVINHTDFISGVFWGGLSGWIGGGIGQFIGGEIGAFIGGSASNAVAQIPGCLNGQEFDYRQMLLSGGLSYGMYYGASYCNWKYRGGNKMGEVDVSFKQFRKMQTLFQRSRAWQREMGGYLMEDGSFRKVPNGTNCQITFETTPPDGAIAEFHTHWDQPGKTISFDENGNYVTDPTKSRYVSTTSRYHGITDFTEGIKSLVLNRYDGSYFSGEYKIQPLPNGFIGPPQGPLTYQVINPPVLRYNYGYVFSIRF